MGSKKNNYVLQIIDVTASILKVSLYFRFKVWKYYFELSLKIIKIFAEGSTDF